MKILVTGATGFVGRNLLLDLLAKPEVAEVISVVRNPEKLRAQLAQEGFGEIPEKLSIVTAEAPEWKFEPLHPSHVIHTAGLISAPTRAVYDRINVHGTRRLLEQLPDVPTLILSSQAATGPTPANRSARHEDDPPAPCTWYGESKLEMERQIREHFPERSICILRPPMVLGPRDSATLPLFRLAQSPVRIKPGFTPKSFSWIAVADLVNAIEQVFRVGIKSETYFVAAPPEISDRELIQTAGQVLHRNGILIPIPLPVLQAVAAVIGTFPYLTEKIPNLTPDRVGDLLADRWVVDASAFAQDFSWKATQTLTPTLQETAAWYQQQQRL